MSWCIDCQDDFRYDDTGGYNPPCACRLKCAGCCQGRCERDDEEPVHLDDRCDLCDRQWAHCECDGEAVSVNHTQNSKREVKE